MKKFVTISLFLFIAVVSGVVIVGLVYKNDAKQAITGSNTETLSQAGDITGVNAGATSLTLSTAELRKHNGGGSCWLLISGKIYDVTGFLNSHPGNADTILPTCGTDATEAYSTKGEPGGKPHSANAEAMLADYYIGDLNQSVKTNPTNPSNPPISNPAPAKQFRYDDDDEFDD